MDVGRAVRAGLHHLFGQGHVLQVRTSFPCFTRPHANASIPKGLTHRFQLSDRTAAFVYDDFVSRPWTDVHFQEIYCDHRYKLHASSSEHCLNSTATRPRR